jgi:hypothetical protein
MASAARTALGVVLLRLRITEESHQAVAELLQDMPAERSYRPRSLVEVGVDEVAPVLRVKLRGEAGRADKIAEHDPDRSTLGRNQWHGRRAKRMDTSRFEFCRSRRQSDGAGDCLQQPFTVADR